MKKTLLAVILLSLCAIGQGQTVTINPAPLSTTQLNGLGSSNYHVSEYIYTDAEIGNTNFTTAGTAINQINLNMTATSDKPSQVFSNVKIYLKEVTATGFSAGTYSTAGYTEVYNGTFPATTVGWTGVTLTTPFVRTAGNNLQMMIERTDNVLPYTTTAPPTWQATTVNSTGSRRYNGTTALSAATALSVSSFRVVVQFKHAFPNDASVTSISSVGKLPVGYAGSQSIVATITNGGTSALTNLPVSLNVTGANTYSNTQSVASLAAGASTTVTFNGYAPSAIGNNVLTVSVASDDDNTNNSLTQNQVSTATTFALANNDAFTTGGSIGFNTGSGNLLVKMPVYQNNNLTSVRVSISADASTAGNTVYGVLLSSTGTIITQSPNYVIQNADLGQYVTFTFPAPSAVTAGTTYYIGLAQTANTTTGYFPVNTQSSKTNLSHSTPLAGGTITDYSTFGSLMIEGIFTTAFPVTLSSFTGVKQGSINKLYWTTESEMNNAGFSIERSADGKNFSTIGYVAAKTENGNSNTPLNYSFNDEKPIAGSNYYRLKQTDRDGKYSYSSLVVLKGEKGFYLSSLYPNPTRDALSLAITSEKAEKTTINITDMNGKLIKQLVVGLSSGENNVTLNVGSLAAGYYTVQVINSNMEVKTQRFIKN